jgi:hypothetical protein
MHAMSWTACLAFLESTRHARQGRFKRRALRPRQRRAPRFIHRNARDAMASIQRPAMATHRDTWKRIAWMCPALWHRDASQASAREAPGCIAMQGACYLANLANHAPDGMGQCHARPEKSLSLSHHALRKPCEAMPACERRALPCETCDWQGASGTPERAARRHHSPGPSRGVRD